MERPSQTEVKPPEPAPIPMEVGLELEGLWPDPFVEHDGWQEIRPRSKPCPEPVPSRRV